MGGASPTRSLPVQVHGSDLVKNSSTSSVYVFYVYMFSSYFQAELQSLSGSLSPNSPEVWKEVVSQGAGEIGSLCDITEGSSV